VSICQLAYDDMELTANATASPSYVVARSSNSADATVATTVSIGTLSLAHKCLLLAYLKSSALCSRIELGKFQLINFTVWIAEVETMDVIAATGKS